MVVDAIQTDMLLTHGGMPGLRDENGLESALARPQQRFAYEPQVDLAALAAAYGFGLARDHPYNDGNKRVAFMVMAVFGNIITARSWFGVNMLGIGLHSYGFMDAALFWLVTFILLQWAVMFIGCLPDRSWKSAVGART